MFRRVLFRSAFGLVVVCLSSCAPSIEPTVQRLGGESELAALYTEIGDAHGVPPEIIATIPFVETRLRPQPLDQHGHGPGIAFDPRSTRAEERR